MNTEPQTDTYRILADTEVYQSGEGYERTMVMIDWHPTQPSRLMQAQIRVDRVPGSSFAYASVWTTANGWVRVVDYHSVRFWANMPGYLRWHQDNSDVKTRNLGFDLAYELGLIAGYSDL